VLDDRHADFLVPVSSEQLARGTLEPVPAGDFRRQHVVHPARRLDPLLLHSRSAVFRELSGLTEPSASITNRVPSRPARRGMTMGWSSTCALTADANPRLTSRGGTPAIVRTRPGVPMSNISR